MSSPDCTPEEWRAVAGYEGVYEISSHGNLRRAIRGVYRMLRGCLNELGYRFYHLRNGNRSKTARAHQLVAIAFIPKPAGDVEVNHKDGCKTNNHVENLEWVTHRRNVEHATETGLVPRGSDLPHAKLTAESVAEIRKHLSEGVLLQREIAVKFGITPSNVSAILRNKSWNHA